MYDAIHDELDKLARSPIFFERNRVARTYTGGKLFADFFGDDGLDNHYPEEWIASPVKAINKGRTDPKEGVSVIRGTDIYFDDFLKSHKRQLIGAREKFDVLVKMLDSAIRLPVQAHPDKAFSRKHLSSNYGKTECWLVIATRENAKLYFGFSREVTPEEFSRAVERSIDGGDAFTHMLNEISATPGDCFFIPGSVIHAIGAGCLILELQEPTDFVVQPEYWCGDYLHEEREMYMGLGKELALSMFDYSSFGESVVSKYRVGSAITEQKPGVKKERFIDEKITDCFGLNKITIRNGQAVLNQAPAIYVVSCGEGRLEGNDYLAQLKKGDYFFLPYAANEKYCITSGGMELFECLPSRKS